MKEYNENYKGIINDVIRKKLGVNVNMECNDKGWLTDTIKEDVNKKMRGNKILRSLFSSAELYGMAYDMDEEVFVSINIGYKHTNGGSNGHELLNFNIIKDTKKVVIR